MEEVLINCRSFNVAFSVPNVLVDSYISSLTEVQLKLILYVLRHSNEKISIVNISKDLKINVLKIKEALVFLKEKGILDYNTSKKIQNIEKSERKDSVYETVFKYKKPDLSFVVDRINNSKEISFLMKEAQNILGRPISNLDSAALIMLHDTDGLPVNVILMLMEYCSSIGKVNMKYIEKVAITWSNEGIDTIEKAEKKIKSSQNEAKAWDSVRRTLGLENRSPTSKESEICNKWINDLKISLDLIKMAFDRCIDIKGKYIVSYMDAILKDWLNKKITNVKDLDKFRKKLSNKKGLSSYNIEDYVSTMDIFA